MKKFRLVVSRADSSQVDLDVFLTWGDLMVRYPWISQMTFEDDLRYLGFVNDLVFVQIFDELGSSLPFERRFVRTVIN